MKKIDKLGRFVIPSELRAKYNFTEGTEIEILDVGEGILIKSSDCFCKICHGEIADGSVFPLCEQCISTIAKNYYKSQQRKMRIHKY